MVTLARVEQPVTTIDNYGPSLGMRWLQQVLRLRRGVTERAGGGKANDVLNRAYKRLKDNDDFWNITMIDPGNAHLFDAVYVRGLQMRDPVRGSALAIR